MSDRLVLFSMMVAFVLFACASCMVWVRGWTLIPMVLLRVTAVLAVGVTGFWMLLASEATVTAIMSDTCDTGAYEVRAKEETLTVWYNIHSGRQEWSAQGDFTVPVLRDCGEG